MKFESSKVPSKVIDIRTGKALEEVEKTENGPRANVSEQFDALLHLLNDEGLKFYRQNGFAEEKKLRKISIEELNARKQEFIVMVLANIDRMCDFRRINFWITESHRLLADTNKSQADMEMELAAYDKQFMTAYGLSSTDLKTLKELFL